MPFVDGLWKDEEEEENPSETPTDPTPDPTPEEPTEKPITDSILLTVKKMMGIAEEYHAFDLDLTIHVNSVFLNLNQLGIGPEFPYSITGTKETWDDFLGEQRKYLAAVQTYVYLKTRLLFDPPTNSFIVESFNKQIEEFEWRFTIQPKSEEDVTRYKENLSKFYHKEYVPEENQNGSEEEPEPDTPTVPDDSPTPQRLKSAKARTLYDIFS